MIKKVEIPDEILNVNTSDEILKQITIQLNEYLNNNIPEIKKGDGTLYIEPSYILFQFKVKTMNGNIDIKKMRLLSKEIEFKIRTLNNFDIIITIDTIEIIRIYISGGVEMHVVISSNFVL